MLRRAFPMVPVVTATVCAVLGLGAARQLYDAQHLDLPPRAEFDVPRVPENPEPPSPPAVAPIVTPPPPKPLPPPARVREPLRLVLVATSVASDERGSTATILSGAAVGVYATGERMPSGAILAHVAESYIDVDHDGERQRFRIGPAAAAPPKPEAPDDTVSRAEIQALLADPTPLLREGTRVRPGADGVRVTGVRPGSLAARLGLESGDLIVSVDGIKPTSPDAALELVGRVRTASTMSVEIARRGQTLTRVLRIL